MNIFLLLLIGISLSMDTFSLSLSLGTFNIRKKDCVLFSCIVAFFHFFMPIIGNYIGVSIQNIILINSDKLLAIVLIFVAIEMIVDLKSKKDWQYFDFKLFNMILYGFSVSIDSLTVGVGLSGFTTYPLLASLIFSLTALVFTYSGLLLGKYSGKKFGKLANIIGLLLIIFLAIMQLLK